MDLQSQKYAGVARSTGNVLAENSAPTSDSYLNAISVINAAAHAQCDITRAGLKQLLPELEKRPGDVGLILTLVQIYMLAGAPDPAIVILETFLRRLEASTAPADQDVRFAPGLVAVMVSLYSAQGRKAGVKAELEKSAAYWQTKPQPSESLLRAAGLSLLDSSRPEDLVSASEIFASLRKRDPNDRFAIAGYVASYSLDPSVDVESELGNLTSIERLTAGIDASDLELAGVATARVPGTSASKKRGVEAQEEKPAKKRTRKPKLPKDYDPDKVVDPERWLPVRDRSSYRPKGKKGKKKVADSTQGGVVKEDAESLDLVGGAGKVAVEKAAGSKKGKKKGKR